MTGMDSDLIGTADIAAISGRTRRTVEWLVGLGRIVPAAVVSERNIWSRSWAQTQDWELLTAGEPIPAPPPLALVGIDDFAVELDRSVAAVRWRINEGYIPQPDAKVSGALVWYRGTFDYWQHFLGVSA